MRPRHFAAQLLVAAAAIFAAELGLRHLSRNSVPRQVLREAAGSGATHVFFGNSLVAAGIDPKAFEAARPGSRARNLGLGSSSPVEHYLIFRAARPAPGTTAFYGFFDTQVTDPPAAVGGGAELSGNQAMSYFTEPRLAAGYYYPGDPVRAWQMAAAGRAAFLTERFTVWAKVERLRRRLGAIGLPAEQGTRFGRVEDFAALAEASPEAFAERCRAASALAAPLRDLLADARAAGVRVVVVEMPMPAAHRARFHASPEWRAYRASVAELVRGAGADVVSASDWITDDHFADALHLAPSGAVELSRRLAAASP